MYTAEQKTQLKQYFRSAREERLAEQDRYLETMRSIEEQGDPGRILSLEWKDIVTAMMGEKYPPGSKERQELLGLNWDQAPIYRKLEKIEDEEVSSHLFHYNQVAEHTLHIRSTARFYELVGAVNTNTNFLYGLWAMRFVHLSLASEAKDSGDDKKAGEMEAEAIRLDEIAVSFLNFLREKSDNVTR